MAQKTLGTAMERRAVEGQELDPYYKRSLLLKG